MRTELQIRDTINYLEAKHRNVESMDDIEQAIDVLKWVLAETVLAESGQEFGFFLDALE
jgi:hypothetical protein